MYTVIKIMPDLFSESIQAIENAPNINFIELDWDTFNAHSIEIKKLYDNDKKVISLTDILPTEVSGNLSDISSSARTKILDYLQENILKCIKSNVKYFEIDLGTERLQETINDTMLDTNISFISFFLPICENNQVTITLPVRYPSLNTETSMWRNTIQIVHNAKHKYFKLQLNIYMNELDDNFKIAELLRDCYFDVASIRFCYDISETKYASEGIFAEWAKQLKWHSYKGLVVFVPKMSKKESLEKEIVRLNNIIDKYFRLDSRL